MIIKALTLRRLGYSSRKLYQTIVNKTMAASTIFQVMIFICLSICVWTLPTTTKRLSNECTDEFVEVLKGVEVSRMVLVCK